MGCGRCRRFRGNCARYRGGFRRNGGSRRSCGSLRCGRLRRGLSLGLNRAGGSCLHAPRSRGLIRRRLGLTFGWRGRRRFGFVGHSSRTRKPPAQAALRRTLTSISLRIRCQRGCLSIFRRNDRGILQVGLSCRAASDPPSSLAYALKRGIAPGRFR
jgi:hypothetical protein